MTQATSPALNRPLRSEPPQGYVWKGELLWPASDKHCYQVVRNLDQLRMAMDLCEETRVAVQAGGNCGVWPHAMGAVFDHVYTFEPDPMNFRCLCHNAPGENVHKFNAALGDMVGACELTGEPDNIGAYQVANQITGGHLTMMLIDDLDLPACDLIYLDIEGYEWRALQGAARTIHKYRPVIAYEDKGLSERYGTGKGFIEKMLGAHPGYRVVARPGRDVLMVPS